HVPYRGGAGAMTDLLGGRLSLMIEVMPNAYPQVQDRKLRALAVTTAARTRAAPEIPTFAEAGVAGMELVAWDALFAPAGTAPAIVAALNGAIRKALGEPAMSDALLARGAEAVPSTPEALRDFVVSEGEKWAAIVKASGAQVD
ncbi:MAG: tripartite tricarboxylate transporter substrate binding protein, partial [Methylobacteriaceae bacterium]|nr:tripartite tricarboxylate transporter substrate binding protein [Methylobacteriaceae bacterium]